jgi:hypothetical protein
VISSPAARSALPSTCGGTKFSGQTETGDWSSFSNCFAIGSVTSDAGNRLSAGNTPVALYQAFSACGECRNTRNCAAASGFFDHFVMNASEDCVTS